MANALELAGVSAGYGETVVLEDINLALAPGESVSVIGRGSSGSVASATNPYDVLPGVRSISSSNAVV